MARFAKGVDHVLPNVHADDEVCENPKHLKSGGGGRTVHCLAGQEIPNDVLPWFRRHKPGWIAGGAKAAAAIEKAIHGSPEDKSIKPMNTGRK